MMRSLGGLLGFVVVLAGPLLAQVVDGASEVKDPAQLRQEFGEQVFVPEGGFVLGVGQTLPGLVWEDPGWIAEHVGEAPVRTRWFNEDFEQVGTVGAAGRYYVYGEASGPGGATLKKAMTAYAVGAGDLRLMAERLTAGTEIPSGTDARRRQIDLTLEYWRSFEEGAVELAGLLEGDYPIAEPRPGQWQMENATRQVRLKRKLMGLDATPPVEVRARPVEGAPAPVLREGSLEEAGVSAAYRDRVEARLDAWYASAKKPTAVVIARDGVIVVNKAYGMVDGRPVTSETPMLLHSAMKPLIGLQLAMYVDRGHVGLDEPIGRYLPEFGGKEDEGLTFRAGHVHATGIEYPWPLAFSRLFYFKPWQDSMISLRTREWAPGEQRKYGVVGIILSVRALELMSGRNYWDAMERELFEPLGIRHAQPGGTGFAAEDLARVGVLLASGGKYGDQELFSEETYRAIVPTSLKPYFPNIDMKYGIGLQDYEALFGAGSYGHAGGCGTQLIVNPQKRLVFAMVRNERGDGYREALEEVLEVVEGAVLD